MDGPPNVSKKEQNDTPFHNRGWGNVILFFDPPSPEFYEQVLPHGVMVG